MSQGSRGNGRPPRTSFRFGVADTFPGPLSAHGTGRASSGATSAQHMTSEATIGSLGKHVSRSQAPSAKENVIESLGTGCPDPKDHADVTRPPLNVQHIKEEERGASGASPQAYGSITTRISAGPAVFTISSDSDSASEIPSPVLSAPQRQPQQEQTASAGGQAGGPHDPPCAALSSIAPAYSIPPHVQGSVELESVLASLDDSQRAAVCFDPSAPLLIQAGAGSGKTQTMASRIAFLLLCGVPPRRVLGICFTRQAAETLRQRVRAVLPPSLQASANQLTLKTLHSFGLQCLRRFGAIGLETEVYDASKQRALARKIVERHAVHNKSSDAVEQLVEFVNKAKMKKELPAAQVSPNVQDGYLFRFYEAALHEEERAVDFGDLQRLFFDMLRPVRSEGNSGGGTTPPTLGAKEEEAGNALLEPSAVCRALRQDYTHIVVDEFQDFNEIQFEILAHLAGDACRVTCVGDPNQCIYEWRGAMPNVFQAWKGRFPQTELRILQVNYRSDAEIVSALNGLVSTHQNPHNHRADRKITLIRCDTDDAVFDAVPFVIENIFKLQDSHQGGYGDMAVLCRTRRRVQVMCEALRCKNIPVKELKGVSPDGISIVRALLAYLKLAVNPDLDGEVRVALSSGPKYLPLKQSKNLFFGLAAMAAERRERAALVAAGSDPHGAMGPTLSPSASLLCSPAGNPISPFSYYALLSEAAFHDFAEEDYPKLKGPSKAQCKTIKHFITVIREAHERLYRPPTCDVADLIRTIAREGGFESENPVTVDGGAPSVAAATARKRRRADAGSSEAPGSRGGRSRRASSTLADNVAADYNRHSTTAGEDFTDTPETVARREEALARRLAKLPRVTEADDGFAAPYTAEEEAAMLATTRVSVTELLLCAYEDVMEEMRAEEDDDRAGQARSVPYVPPTPATILRRVLDQFVTLLPSDDFGSLKTVGSAASTGTGTAPAAALPTQPTQGEASSTGGRASYPHGHRQTTTVNKVTVSTVHRAKGMEWSSVIIPDCWVGEFPTGRQDREERRVFYVAMSRAMTNLVLLTARTSHDPRYSRKSADGRHTGEEGAAPREEGAVALVETPYLAQMKGKEMVEEEYTALRLSYMQAQGTW